MWLPLDEGAYFERLEEQNFTPATESELHRAWHRENGVPLGQPGCPQDACHLPDDIDGEDQDQAVGVQQAEVVELHDREPVWLDNDFEPPF